MSRTRPKRLVPFCFASFLLCFLPVLAALAQNIQITIKAINGKDGKPLAHQRLVIFGGESPEAATFHHTAMNATTDENGLAVVSLVHEQTSWIQIWTDGLTLCQKAPNTKSFSVDTILSSGLSTPNNCGSIAEPPTSRQITVFARPATVSEKMAR
jgi:hypothetical protein